MVLDIVAISLSIISTGFSCWSFWIADSARKTSTYAVTAANAIANRPIPSPVVSTQLNSGYSACGSCGHIVARYNTVAGKVVCANCQGSK